jgi:uncharacterized coiled-coil DUF342 family protein
MEREDKKAKAAKVIEYCMAHGDSLGEAMVHADSYLQVEQVDSREKLENDTFNFIARMVNEAYTMGEHEANWHVNRASVHECIGELLDRQAAISTHEVSDSYEHVAERQSDRIFELHNKLADALERVDSLTAERDELLAKVDELNANWRKSNDGWAEANAEAEQWRQKCDQLRKDLDHALAFPDCDCCGWQAERDKLRDEVRLDDIAHAELCRQRDDLAHELRRARKAAKRWHELASGYRDKAAQFVEIIETLTATLDRKNARIKRLRGKLKRARNK